MKAYTNSSTLQLGNEKSLLHFQAMNLKFGYIVGHSLHIRDGMGSQSCNWFNTRKNANWIIWKKSHFWELKDCFLLSLPKYIKRLCCQRVKKSVGATMREN
jgi:hypothetical protein